MHYSFSYWNRRRPEIIGERDENGYDYLEEQMAETAINSEWLPRESLPY